jgi:hypothetical protein
MSKVHLFTMASLTTLMLLGAAQPAISQEQSQSSLPESSTPAVAVDQINQAIEALATELMTSLPPTGTYAVKNANDTSSGAPEDLLAQITSTLQTSLMVASNFSLTLIDQAQLQESWANAVEFNGADFETMVSQANFDALIVLNTRATPAGLEISLQAVGATSIDAGQILASTKLRSVDINWNEFKSVDYSEKMSDKVLEIQRQLEVLKSQNEPVLKPTTFADHYHNATIYKKNNEGLKEIASLENALRIEPKFYDVLSDLLQVLVKVFGTEAASKFVEARLTTFLPPEMVEYSMIMLEFEGSDDFPAIIQSHLTSMEDSNSDELSPLAAQWIKSSESTFLQSLRNRQKNLSQYPGGEPGTARDLYNFLSAVRIVMRSYNSGEFQKLFLDTNRSYAAAEIEKMRDFEREFNQVEYATFSTTFDQDQGLIHFYTKWQYNEQRLPISSELVEVKKPNTLNVTKVDIDDVWAPCNFKAVDVVPKLELEDPRVLVNFPVKFTDPSDPKFKEGDFWYEFPGLPIDVFTDRIVFSDACKDALEEYRSSGWNIETEKIRGLHRLLITDEVDVSKPIILEFNQEESEQGMLTYKVDISTDGTYFLQGGAPINSTSVEGFDVFPAENNGWLFAPGIVQSSLYSGGLVSVSYTDIFGVEKTIVNGERSNIPNIRVINGGDGLDVTGAPLRGSVLGGNYSALLWDSISRAGQPKTSDVGIAESEGVENSNGSTVDDDAIADSEDSLIQWRIMTDTETVVTSFRSLTFDDRTAVQEILASKGLYNGAIDGKWGEGTRLAFEILFTALQSNGVKYYVNTPDNFVSMMIMVKDLEASYFSSAMSERKETFGMLCDGDNFVNNCFGIRGWTHPGEGSLGDVYIGFWDQGAPNGFGALFINGRTLVGRWENGQQAGDMKLSDTEKTLEGHFVGEELVDRYDTPYVLDVRGNNSESMMEISYADGPSFDCNKASTTAERTICTYRGTSQADQTAADYYELLKRARGPEVAKSVGRFFMNERDKCGPDPDCMDLVLYYSAAVFHDLSLPDR